MASDPYSAIEPGLIAKAQSGDEAAFAAILHRYRRPILDFVYRMVGNADTAQDVAQDVFVRAWRGIGRFTHRRDQAGRPDFTAREDIRLRGRPAPPRE